MKRNYWLNKAIVVGILVLVLGMTILQSGNSIVLKQYVSDDDETGIMNQESNDYRNVETWNYAITFSTPEISDYGDYVKVDVKEANAYTIDPGEPMLPFYSLVATFPLGTEIIDVTCIHSEPSSISIDKSVVPAPQPQWLDYHISQRTIYGEVPICRNKEQYQNSWYTYKSGGGIKAGEHVTFLSIHLYPVRYLSETKILQFIDNAEIIVTYEKPSQPLVYNDEYQLVVIAPESFSTLLQPLVDHKNNYGVSTKMVTLQEIYNGDHFTVQGRDEQEKIKYFIKDAFKQWGTGYILLVGSIYKVPIRKTYYGEFELPTDLYYADLFFDNGSFCSWDSNGNNLFGEYWHGGEDDLVDLYPDVYIGRLPCFSNWEVRIVVDKIINYEENTYGEEWFNTMILCGGDTFPFSGVLEGEFTNNIIANIMSDFTHVKLWTSDDTFSPETINHAINTGAGFFEYSGHGYERGMGTHPPNYEKRVEYFTRDMLTLRNGYKLPIMFFDACLTATLDYELANRVMLLRILNIQIPLSCFAWSFVKKLGGGAIASVGATRVAYSMVDETGVHSGAGYLAIEFFKAYEPGILLGEMLVEAKNEYINSVWKDYFTMEEFILLGDPTLKVGGYQ